ncbi:MAG: sulfatase modifying factor 1 [Cyclobacteriaceae bacterium]|jgi:sulfatase modifying factor 1
MRKKYTAIILIALLGCSESAKKTSAVETPAAKKEETVSAPNIKKQLKEESKPASTERMIFFNGGKIDIGSTSGTPDEGPVFEMNIKPFHLDKNLVTVAEFRKFIQTTGFKTDADKFGDSGVFDFTSGNWILTKGANWEYPFGTDQPKGEDTHPVTHVSWNDAEAYATWLGKRLPTEFEWEYAAKNGKNTMDKYAWGNKVVDKGRYQANVWQGPSVTQPEVLDGYMHTSPVGVFGEHASGLTDMGGNVWQWCSNTYESYPGSLPTAPKDESIKSTRGGSFMYDQAGDASFTMTFRSKNTTDTSLFNTGFRCAL